MRLVYHGGKCCGIKTIYDMGDDPQEMLAQKKAGKNLGPILNNLDRYGYQVSSNKYYFREACPRESRLDRLDRMLDFLAKNRPSGIVEITLHTTTHGHWGQEKWFPLLKKRGFKKVTECKNSNSGNFVSVWHLKMEGTLREPWQNPAKKTKKTEEKVTSCT